MTLFTGNYSDQCRLTAARTTTRGSDGTNLLPVKKINKMQNELGRRLIQINNNWKQDA